MYNSERYKLDNLPEIKHDFIFTYDYELKKYIKSYTGTILRRPGTESAGIFYHYAFFYGVDKNNVIWLISNDKRGVECLCFDDYMENWSAEELEIEPIVLNINKENIIKRAIERCNKPFHIKLNNCERFVNYVVYGENDVGWQSKIFELIGKILFLPFDYQIEMSGDLEKKRNWERFKNRIGKPKIISIDKKNEKERKSPLK